jgi:universal stress protein A
MLIKPHKVMWPTDFSELSLRAAAYARAFVEHFEAELHVVHVCRLPTDADVTAWGAGVMPLSVYESIDMVRANQTAEIRGAMLKRLRSVAAEQFGENPHIVCRVLTGMPWQAICGYEHEAGIDLIVLATHGRTGLRHMLMGSTAEKVIRYARCPVLAVKPFERDFVSDESPREIELAAQQLCGQGI